MIQEIEKYLNCNEFLRNNIDKYKEAFIKYYGEDKREAIETAFSKAIFIAFQPPRDTESYIRTIREEKSKEIIGRGLEGCQTFTIEDINNSSLENRKYTPIEYYIKFLEKFKQTEEERRAEYNEQGYKAMKKYLPELTKEEFDEMFRTGKLSKKYDVLKSWVRGNLEYWIDPNTPREQMEKDFEHAKPLLSKIDSEMTIDTYSYYADDPRLQELDQISTKYPGMVEEYTTFMQRYQKIINELEEGKAHKKVIEDEAYRKLVEKNIDLIPESKRKGLKEFLDDPGKSYLLDNFVSQLFGYGLNSCTLMDSFTTEAEEILKKGQPDWKINNIQEERIKFLKALGIDLGDDYAAYENNEEARSLWPTNERADTFLKIKQEIQNKANIEYYESLPFFKRIRGEIDAHHPLDKEDSFNAGLFTNPGTFVNPNVIKTPTGYDLFSLLVVACESRTGTIDHNIIHELNHLYELSLDKVEGNSYEGICGWDILEGNINQLEVEEVNTLTKDKQNRPYTLFNEIINEIIAQEVCEKFREDGNYIFDTPDIAKDKHTTSYESTFFLVRDFYSEFKDKIIASRHNGNIQIIWDEVGKENFDALNDLFAVFNDNFEGFKYYNLLDDLSKKADTPRTQIYYQIVADRDKILEKMRAYSMQHEAAMAQEQPQVEDAVQK